MSRTVPAAILTALAQPEVEPFYAVEIDLDSGPLRLWTGYGDRGVGDALAANQIISGQKYLITSVGTTNFTAIGADSNTVGLFFTATGTGSGTGTVQTAYTGGGTLMSIEGLEEVADLSAKNITLTLSGMPSEVISLALQEPYQRRKVRVLWGVRNVSDFVEVFSGSLNQMVIEDSAESGTISVTVDSKLVELERASNRRYTSESHKSRYATDTFFDFVADIQDKGVRFQPK